VDNPKRSFKLYNLTPEEIAIVEESVEE